MGLSFELMPVSFVAKIKEILTRSPVAFWLALRLISLTVAPLAAMYEGNEANTGSFGKFVLSPWYRYDTQYYVRIVRLGYQTGDITSGFHPLYPWIAHIFNLVTGDALSSLMLVSSIAGFLLTIALYRLVKIDHDSYTSWTATGLFLCWPATISIFTPYTESLFLLLTVWCLLSARRGSFWLAGFAGGLASLTRQQGIFLALPLAWELWEASNRDWRKLIKDWRRWFAVVLVPAGYAAWILYRALAINDVRPNFSSLQGFIYSVMISPSHYQVFHDMQFLPPWTALWKAARILWHGGLHWSAYGDAFLGAVFIAMLVFGWRHLRTSYLIYCVALVLIALSLHTGSAVNPYTSLPRHLFLAFPVFIGLATRYKFRRLGFILFTLALCQELYLCCFVWQTWVL